MAPEKSKGGRHGQTRLCVHGVTHVEFTFVHALGRDSPFQALRCADLIAATEMLLTK